MRRTRFGARIAATRRKVASNLVLSVTPASGSGLNQTFSFSYNDPYGAADIGRAQMNFQTTLVAQSA